VVTRELNTKIISK